MQSDAELERMRRIVIAAWAYAYEVESRPIVSDGQYDAYARLIRPNVSTGHPVLDEFFRTEFAPSTGMWVNRHPEKRKLARITAIMRKPSP